MSDKIPVEDLGKLSDVRFPGVNRVEVIDKNGRSYVNMSVNNALILLQDDNTTLKLFIE